MISPFLHSHDNTSETWHYICNIIYMNEIQNIKKERLAINKQMTIKQKDDFYQLDIYIVRHLRKCGIVLNAFEREILKYDLSIVAMCDNDDELLENISKMADEYLS